jgi:alkaline phosphatase D
VTALPDNGFTVKVDATGLQAGTEYWYRFRHGMFKSPIGRTRTLPATGVDEVRMAVFSCSNYPAGRFHAYAEALSSGAQYAVHLGDYIYEYGSTGYASEQAVAMGRVSDPLNECISLDDYRRRHAQYKSDPDSKDLHARMPFIAVWDDHETANDAWRDGAENHDSSTEGTWVARRAAALQAYHEWMPIRTGSSREKIYRSFDFGDLVSLHMLDTRLIGRDRQVSIGDLVNPATQAAASQALFSPTREMLGTEQSTWLQQRLGASPGRWQVLGQQVLMARMEFPATVLQALNPENTSPDAIQQGQIAINDYLTAKNTPANFRTPEQQALLDPATNPKLGYNLDAWDGYPIAREKLLNITAQAALARGCRLVSLAGDTHNAWYSELTTAGYLESMGGLPANASVGIELATPGVSSPGLEEYLTIKPADVKAIFENIVDDLNWADTERRGFLLLSFTPQALQADWIFVSDVTRPAYTAVVGHSETIPYNNNP